MVLEILISGLVAFVKQSCVVKDAKMMHIVMVKGQQAHQPRLIVDIRDVVVDPADPDDIDPDEIIELPGGSQFAVWSLQGKAIELSPSHHIQIKEGNRTHVDATDVYRNSYPEEYQPPDPPNDFSWAPELHRACFLPKDTGQTEKDRRAKQDVLKKEKLGSFGVARFLPLDVDPTADPKENFLEAVSDYVSADDVYEFPGQVDNYKQVLAARARLELTMDTKPFEIRLHAIGQNPYKKIRLRSPDGRKVSVSISNLPKKKPKDDDPAAHFHEYYKLLNYAKSDECPNPKQKTTEEQRKGEGKKGVHPVKCVICEACGG